MPRRKTEGPKPRRTAERILDVALDLFNRFGEPNVSTTAIAAGMDISPGNLHYHYPAKEELANALFARFERALTPLLAAAGDVRNVEDAWLFFHMLFERIWEYRFLYRDLNDLLSRNRLLETRFQAVLKDKNRAVRAALSGLGGTGTVHMHRREAEPVATAMVVVITYWLSYEYVRDPRHALERATAEASLMRGAAHVLGLLLPYADPSQREHLQALIDPYAGGDAR